MKEVQNRYARNDESPHQLANRLLLSDTTDNILGALTGLRGAGPIGSGRPGNDRRDPAPALTCFL